MLKINEQKLVIAGLTIIGLVFSVLAFTTEIPEGGADNYAHFNIARWAFRYPHLFIDHWGKPVFTIIFAPVAQFGFAWVRIFNTILALFTAWYAWKLAKLFKLNYSWFAPVVVIFTPIYFVLMSTGMTEIIFSLMLMVSVYLFFKEKYVLSALFVSFMFLARNEGLAFLLPFLIALILKKQYKAIPFLATGFVVFSLIGWVFHYHDFLWLINDRPYAKGATVYGSGKWNHFFVTMPNYFGNYISVLLIAGTISMLYNWLSDKRKFNSDAFLQILLILGTFWGYFFIHGYLWWKTETSAGLQRVMAGVSPMIGIMAVFAIDLVAKYIRGTYIKLVVLAVLSVFLVYKSADFYKKSLGYDGTAEVLRNTTKWLIESGSYKHKLVMHNPYFAFSTKIDAWNNEVVQYGFYNNDMPENGLPDSTIFIWDAHFSANEGLLPFDKIMNNPNFEIVKYFEPKVPFKVLGNNDYRIVIFRKITNVNRNNNLILEKLKREQIEKGIYFIEEYDCESPFSAEYLENRRIQSPVDSSNYILDLSGIDFSPVFHVPYEIIDPEMENIFHISADFLRSDSIVINRLLMVFSVEIDNKSIHYVTSDICEQIPQKDVWHKTNYTFYVPDNLEKGTILKSYIWNIDKRNVLMDNYKLEISKKEKD